MKAEEKKSGFVKKYLRGSWVWVREKQFEAREIAPWSVQPTTAEVMERDPSYGISGGMGAGYVGRMRSRMA